MVYIFLFVSVTVTVTLIYPLLVTYTDAVMVKVSEYLSRKQKGGAWLRSSDITSGVTVTIAGSGTVRGAEETPFHRETFELPIRLPNGEEKLWTVNTTTLKRLSQTWGDDSEQWVGKRVRLEVAKQIVRGEFRDVIYGYPIEEEVEEERRFINELKGVYGSKPVALSEFISLLKARGIKTPAETIVRKYGLKIQGSNVVFT